MAGLSQIMLSVFSFNAPAIRTYQKAGFREIGCRREAVRVANRAFDVIYMDCLSTELESSLLRQILP